MSFWDASAVVPLLVNEPASHDLHALARRTPDLVVWWGTYLECVSALARRRRDHGLTEHEETAAINVLQTLANSWTEVLPTRGLRDDAVRLVRVHPLRAADSLQLAAALAWVEGRPRGAPFVTRDARLAGAAGKEGFSVE